MRELAIVSVVIGVPQTRPLSWRPRIDPLEAVFRAIAATASDLLLAKRHRLPEGVRATLHDRIDLRRVDRASLDQRLRMPSSVWNADRDRELKHLKAADRHIDGVSKRIARQRVIVQAAFDKGRPCIEAQSLLAALESSRRAFEKHREFIINLLANSGRLPPRDTR
jgi:hypothetical protein